MSRKMVVVMTLAATVLLVIAYMIGQDDEGPEIAVDQEGSSNGDEDAAPEDATFDNYGVSTSNEIAEDVGMEVLENGGNAVDAAIAISLTLGVVEPYGSGIGGGGAMLVLNDPSEEPMFYDYREISPADGRENQTGVPGFLKGLETVHEELATMEMGDLMAPAIRYAEEGFPVDDMLANRLEQASYRLDDASAPEFYPGGRPIQEGETLVQERLAETLEHLRDAGFEDFYSGSMAGEFAGDSSSITEEDLAAYEVVQTEPASGSFHDYQVYSAPPPMSGVTLIQMLQMAEALNLSSQETGTTQFAHLHAEIGKQAYSDRLSNIGDPAFAAVDMDEITSVEYSEELASEIETEQLSYGFTEFDAPAELNDHSNTTHIVVVDEDGQVVSATNTLSNFFGAGVMTESGIFLNNQMDNFATSETSPNAYEAHKRARSFIAPTLLVSGDGDEVIGLGSPGGRRIPQILSQVLIAGEQFDEGVDESIELPRVIAEGDEIVLESEWSEESQEELQELGYTVETFNSAVFYGGIQQLTIDFEEGTVERTMDPRR